MVYCDEREQERVNQDIAQLLNPPKKEKLHEAIVAQIKGLIHSKKLGVGDKLPSERELAVLFAVSRVVLREALRSLEQAGLIEIKPGPAGGAFIARNLHKPLFHAASDLFHGGELTLKYFSEARRAIECFIVKLAAERAKPEDLARLREINERLLGEIEDKGRFRENNGAFHVAVAEIAGNPLLTLMVQSLIDLLNVVYPTPSQSGEFIRNTYQRHLAIIEAMEQKDSVRCEELMAIDTEHTAKLST